MPRNSATLIPWTRFAGSLEAIIKISIRPHERICLQFLFILGSRYKINCDFWFLCIILAPQNRNYFIIVASIAGGKNTRKGNPLLSFYAWTSLINIFPYYFPISEPESSYPSDEQDVACKKALCDCDSEAAKCFANSTFNAMNIDYDTTKCWLEKNWKKMPKNLNKYIYLSKKYSFLLCR